MADRTMQPIPRRLLAACAMLALATGAAAQSDRNAERAARRMQLQVQNLQQQVDAAQAEKAKAEADKTAAEKQLAEHAKARDEQQAQAQRRHDEQVAQIADCSNKNERLVKLSAELLERWRTKSVSDVMRQHEPLLGLGDVEMFNLVQEYRDKADAERYTPPPPTTKR